MRFGTIAQFCNQLGDEQAGDEQTQELLAANGTSIWASVDKGIPARAQVMAIRPGINR